MSAPVLGVTGGVGAGKSTFTRFLADAGARVLDADRIAHEALERPDVREAVADRFGEDVLTGDGRLDRRALAALVFADPDALRRHTEVVYPALRRMLAERIARLRAAGDAPIVLEAATLYEAGAEDLVDRVVTVEAPPAACDERCRAKRGWPAGEAARREAHLIGRDERRRRADAVVKNDGDATALRRAAEAELRRLGASA